MGDIILFLAQLIVAMGLGLLAVMMVVGIIYLVFFAIRDGYDFIKEAINDKRQRNT